MTLELRLWVLDLEDVSIDQHGSLLKRTRRQPNAGCFQLIHEIGTNSRGLKVPAGSSRFVNAFLYVLVNVLHDDRVLLHAHDFGDARHAADTALQSVRLNQNIQGARHLLTHGFDRQIEARHHDHRFQTRDRVARRIGVQGGQRAVVARVHGLQHVQRFRSAALADDDSLGTHTQGVFHQIRRGDRAFAFDVWRPRFQSHDVLLLELQFGRVFDRDDALVIRNEARQRVKQRRFAGARATRDDHVRAGLDLPFQQHHHLGRQCLEIQQVLELQRIAAESTNGNRRAVQRQRRNDRVHAAAVGQTRIDHRADFIDATADLRHDAVDDLQQVRVVAKLNWRPLHLAAALDVDILRPVDQNIADRMVLEQHLQRPQAKGLVEHLLDQALSLLSIEKRLFRIAQVLNNQADLAAEHVALQFTNTIQVELIDQLVVNAALELVKLVGLRGVGCAAGSGKRLHSAEG